MFETIRAYGAVKMGLIKDLDEAKTRQHTPKVAFVNPASNYLSSSGKKISAAEIDMQVPRCLSFSVFSFFFFFF